MTKVDEGIALATFVATMNDLAPTDQAEAWDNVGLLVGEACHIVRRVYFCIDLTTAAADEASALECDTWVVYHPPIFAALRRLIDLTPAVRRAVREGRAIYSPHTAWDIVGGGSSDFLAQALGAAQNLRPLAMSGVGRVITLQESASFAALATRLKVNLGLQGLLQAPTPGMDLHAARVRRIAVCPGAGGSLCADVRRAGAELFVTGELRHHEALSLQAAGIAALCTLHSHSERGSLMSLQTRLLQHHPALRCHQASQAAAADPFAWG